jgi:hypothetical protein
MNGPPWRIVQRVLTVTRILEDVFGLALCLLDV